MTPRLVEPPRSSFDYEAIPLGHYDHVLREGNAVRRMWHLSKFERVLDYLPQHEGQALLDVGCFAGSFLSMAPPERFSRQLGVDILPGQIDYANASYGTSFRRFRHLDSITQLDRIEEPFDAVTLIEVIEHLSPEEIDVLFARLRDLLVPGGKLVVTTPNYASTWPLLELAISRFGDVSYEEQHITRFTVQNLERRLTEIHPRLAEGFELSLKTTTHFITPFLAGLSFDLARRLSRMVPHSYWRLPLGNLVLAVFTRR